MWYELLWCGPIWIAIGFLLCTWRSRSIRKDLESQIVFARNACTAAQNECDLAQREANAARKLLDQDGRRRDKVTVESIREYVIFRAANNQSSRMKDKP